MHPSLVEIRAEPADSEWSQALFREYMAFVCERLGERFAPTEAIFGRVEDFQRQDSVWLVAYRDGCAVGCGGLRMLDDQTAEFKRMFVSADERRRGIGRRLLLELETVARRQGAREIKLLTTESLHEARSLYESAGYDVAEAFDADDPPRTDFWVHKTLS